jgi:hypothetical protein
MLSLMMLRPPKRGTIAGTKEKIPLRRGRGSRVRRHRRERMITGREGLPSMRRTSRADCDPAQLAPSANGGETAYARPSSG